MKALSAKVENVLQYTGSPTTPENIFLAMFAILTCISAVSGQVYWAFIHHPSLLRLVEWSERGPIVFTNESIHLPPLRKSPGPNHPSEEGTAMNISLGYEILSLCVGHPAPCLPVSIQTWFNTLPPTQQSHTVIGLLEKLSLILQKLIILTWENPISQYARLYPINIRNIPLLIGAIVVPALESYLYLLIISVLLIGALMNALYTIVLKIGIGWSVIKIIKLFGKIVHYIENII
jgi:hypothetical protein